jgi:hypothetical protein
MGSPATWTEAEHEDETGPATRDLDASLEVHANGKSFHAAVVFEAYPLLLDLEAHRPGCSAISAIERSTAGAGGGGPSARPSIIRTAPIRASSSPRWHAAATRRDGGESGCLVD